MWKDRKRFYSIKFQNNNGKMDKYCLSRDNNNNDNDELIILIIRFRKQKEKQTKNRLVVLILFPFVGFWGEIYLFRPKKRQKKSGERESEREISKLLNTNKQIINRIEKRLSRHLRTVWNEHRKKKISKLKSKWFSDLCVSFSWLFSSGRRIKIR